ncbi:MAG TPA: hypothetical protein DCZ95_03820 [Verrucomicrobia bacterium]|nr:MAG: hypothetical protein A2X46_02470 [Lentisphaerae bacterium GWF2_57_35]HBA83202.1 hypothetical protein [Verrucomicrobiota bacterium]
MAHNYIEPETNGTFTYSIAYMTQDVAYALSSEFQSEIIVPYNDTVLVDQDGYTNVDYQKVTYVAEIASNWNRVRFESLMEHIANHTPAGGVYTTNELINFSWSSLEKVAGYDLMFSTNQFFGSSITNFVITTNDCQVASQSLPEGQDVFWRVRGVYHVLHIKDLGDVTSTDTYYGAWAPAQSPVRIEE